MDAVLGVYLQSHPIPRIQGDILVNTWEEVVERKRMIAFTKKTKTNKRCDIQGLIIYLMVSFIAFFSGYLSFKNELEKINSIVELY